MLTGPPLSIALAGLDAESLGVGGGVRDLIAWAKGAALRGVQLDVTVKEVRPRELGRSARRELAAIFRRNGLACSGLDLWIPPDHFAAAATVDRAVGAVVSAVELAADLVALGAGFGVERFCPVSLVLPRDVGGGVVMEIEAAAERSGGWVADYAWPPRQAGTAAPEQSLRIGVGVDPALLLSAGADPATEAARLGESLLAARLTDSTPLGTRAVPGSKGGRLDVLAYRVALATGPLARRGGSAVLDLRGLPEQSAAAAAVVEEWGE